MHVFARIPLNTEIQQILRIHQIRLKYGRMQTEYGLKYVRIRMDYKTGHIGLQTGDDPPAQCLLLLLVEGQLRALATAWTGLQHKSLTSYFKTKYDVFRI